MRIGIDARTILNPEKTDSSIGAGHYTYQLIRHILEVDSDNEYVLFFDYKVRDKDVKKFSRKNVKIKFYPFSDYKQYIPGAYSEILGLATLQSEKIDVLHVTSPESRIPVGYHGKTIVTFSDLSAFRVPECLPIFKRKKNQAVCSYMANRADKIIAVSKSIKDDAGKLFNVPDKKIEVVYAGLDKRFLQKSLVKKERVLGGYGINKKYILLLGTVEPMKNITRLIEAFSIFKKRTLRDSGSKRKNFFDYQLVLAGKRGWMSEEYLQIAKDFGVYDDIVFTGYVIGDNIPALLDEAEFLVMPSIYEGFGMTIIEAFARELPAIVSDTASIPEMAGDAVHYINPFDINAIAEALYCFSRNKNVRSEFAKKGLGRISEFDWSSTAEETIEIYRAVVDEK
ncbi:glycosyltransferase family 4 protein [Patescibacteria group bacterium]